jgi:Fe2+ or Zn2+ uptake regulation protein
MLRAAVDPLTTIPDLLARRGFRLTRPRRAVMDVLVRGTAPLSAAEIHRRLRGGRANLVSVYSTVHLLLDLGLLRIAHTCRGTRRFELSEAFTGHDHHLVCQRCGLAEGLAGCLLDQAVMRALHRQVRRSRRFQVTDHDLKLLGLCARCAPA